MLWKNTLQNTGLCTHQNKSVHTKTSIHLQEETQSSESDLNKVIPSEQKHPCSSLLQSSPWQSANFLLYLNETNLATT